MSTLVGREPARFRTGYAITGVIIAVAAYIVILAANWPFAFLQISINGLAIGSIYSIVAIGFSLAYRTARFFDISYGAMPAVGAYCVLYLTNGFGGVGYDVAVATLFSFLAGWLLFTFSNSRGSRTARAGSRTWSNYLAPVAFAICIWLLATQLGRLNHLSTVVAGLSALAAIVILAYSLRDAAMGMIHILGISAGCLVIAAGLFLFLAGDSGQDLRLYGSWLIAALLAGALSDMLWRGVYRRLRSTSRSPLVPMVGSMGILLVLIALVAITFTPNAKSLPPTFGVTPWLHAGVSIKPLHVFFIGVVAVMCLALHYLLTATNFGKSVRAIADDEELSMTVGINTPIVTAAVFFISGAIAALAGIFLAEDTTFHPSSGISLLFKGWIASVLGGRGSIYGAALGGFSLGLIENYGVWYLPTEWKDTIAFALLVIILRFLPDGIIGSVMHRVRKGRVA